MSREELAQFLFESFRKVYEGTETFTKSTISWGHIAAELMPKIERLLAAERQPVTRLDEGGEEKEMDELQERMSCGHFAANLQPDDSGHEFCIVCVELENKIAKERVKVFDEMCEVVKEKRAEVLAAYQRAIVEWRNGYGAMPEDSPVFLVATKLLDVITKLQPAASDLEELLLREQLLEACWWMGNCVEPWEPSAKAKELAENRITELEKAHATEEKG